MRVETVDINQYLSVFLRGGVHFFFFGMLKSLCSFICLQAVYQLSGPED